MWAVRNSVYRNIEICSVTEIMYEELEAIANLKFGEAVERISRERLGKLSAQIADLAARKPPLLTSWFYRPFFPVKFRN
jgi:hypothetical protein